MASNRSLVRVLALIALVPAALLVWFVVAGDQADDAPTDPDPGERRGTPTAGNARPTDRPPDTPVDRPPAVATPPGTPAAIDAPAPPVAPDAFRGGLAGRVVDPGGTALAAVRVRVFRTTADGSAALLGAVAGETLDTEATTDDDGRFAVEVSDAEAAYRIAVTHASFAPFSRAVRLTAFPDETVVGDLRLDVGAIAVGRCVDRAGHGVPGVTVTASHGAAPALRAGGVSSKTDADGRFRIDGCPTGAVTITAGGDRWAVARTDARLTEGRETDGIRLELVPALGLDGDVVDGTGRALAGVDVYATPLGPAGNVAGPAVAAKTDASGAFAIRGLAEGRHRVQAWRQGNLSVERVELAGARGVRLRLDRVRPVTVEGRVVEAGTGVAVVGARVSIEPVVSLDGPASLGEAVSGGDGAFAIELDRGRGRYLVRANAPGYAEARSAPFPIDPTPPRSLRILIDRGATLGGTVTDAQSRAPLAGALVFLREPRGDRVGTVIGALDAEPKPAVARAASDDDGRFRFERLRTGTFDVEVRRTGYAPSWIRDVRLTAGVHPSPLVVALGRGGSIVARVAFVDGGAAVGVAVDVLGRDGAHTAETGPEGLARIDHLAPGRYDVSVRPSGAPRSPFADAAARGGVTLSVSEGSVVERQFRLERGVRLTGVVRERGRGVPGAQLSLRARDPRGRSTREVRTDASGRFTVPDVQPGDYRVQVRLQVGTESYIAVDRPAPIPRVREHRIDVDVPDAEIAGAVRVPDDAPDGVRPRIRIRQLDATPPLARGQLVERDGTFAFRHLEPGRYELVVDAGTGWAGTIHGPLRVGASGVVRGVEVRLEAGVAVRGRVIDSSGSGVAAASVQLIPRGEHAKTPPRSVRTQRSGSFVIEHVTPGAYRMRAVRRNWTSTTRDVDVPPGVGLADLELVLEQSR